MNFRSVLLATFFLGAPEFFAQAVEPPSAAQAARIWNKANFPDTESCKAVVFDPHNPQRIVLGTRPGGLWESLDAGATWAKKPSPIPSAQRVGFNQGSIVAHPYEPATWFAGVEKNGVYRSGDRGQTWRQTNEGIVTPAQLDGICFAFDSSDPGTIYHGTDGGLFKSIDRGDHWKRLTNGLPKLVNGEFTAVLGLACVPTNPQVVYAGFYGVAPGDVPGVYRSNDGGATWTCINNGIATGPDEQTLAAAKAVQGKAENPELNFGGVWVPQLSWTYDLKLSPHQPKVLFAACFRHLYRTVDGGEHWQRCDTVLMPRAVAFHPREPNTVVAFGGTSNVWLSRDGGASWSSISIGLNDPPKTAKQPKVIELGNGRKGLFSETGETFLLNQSAFDPTGQRLFALTSQGLWVAETCDFTKTKK